MGRNCQKDVDFCVGALCGPHSLCVDEKKGYTCYCHPGLMGVYCDIEINECDVNPCHGEATCNDFVGYYTCHCPSGFTGKNCEVNIDDCASDPCHKGATCQDMVRHSKNTPRNTYITSVENESFLIILMLQFYFITHIKVCKHSLQTVKDHDS